MKLLTADQWDNLWEMAIGKEKELADSSIKAILSGYIIRYKGFRDKKSIETPIDYCDCPDLLATMYLENMVDGQPKNIIRYPNKCIVFNHSPWLYSNFMEKWPMKLIKKEKNKVTIHYYRDFQGQFYKKVIFGITNIYGSAMVKYYCIFAGKMDLSVPPNSVINDPHCRITKKKWEEEASKVKERIDNEIQ